MYYSGKNLIIPIKSTDNRYTIVSLIENEPFSRNIKIFSFDNNGFK